MIKVCGITFVHTTNYGTCFQAYALQRAINDLTVGNGERCSHQFVPLWHCKDHFSSKETSFFYSLFLRKFKSFQEEMIQYNECSQISDLKLLNDSFDAFVCGSDVIWNPRFNHKMGLYYLDFAEKYKFSYAASFGKTDIDDSFLQSVGNWISQLSDISVREQSSVDIVKQYTGRVAQVVPDPVLLLTREDWDRIAGGLNKRNKYIFAYTTNPTLEYKQFLNKLSKETGLKVVRAAWIKGMKESLKQGILMIQSPEQWLQQLRDAEYVVTNSFHATVFSSLFHKKFFTVVHGEKNQGSNIRMFDYLSTIGLADRMISSVSGAIDLSEIDFDKADGIIRNMREEGINYLQKNLEAAYIIKREKEKSRF